MLLRRGWIAMLVAAAAWAPVTAYAWGAQGHRIVGSIAEDLLDPPTRAALHDLAGQESLADLATWMDEERPRLSHSLPGSARWHYDDIPVCQSSGAKPCLRGDCASKALERYRAILANRRADPEQRLLALRILVHVVGDIHQPMHAADDEDRGGNEVEVVLSAKSRSHQRSYAHGHGHGHSLHSVWDVDFVRDAVGGESEKEFAADRVAEHARDLKRIEAGSFTTWIGESHAIARDFAYGQLPGFACGQRLNDPVMLSSHYRNEAPRIVTERLADAGIRLAAILRATLGTP
jgi:hypothetical protein